jgi:hypothetical protein
VTTYKSKLNLSLGHVPNGITDPVLYRELLDIHDAIEQLAGQDPSSGPGSGGSHNDLSDVTPDQHHPQVHEHNGVDGSGEVQHSSLVGIGANDHHPQLHNLNSHIDVNAAPAHRDSLTSVNGFWVADHRSKTFIQENAPPDVGSSAGDIWVVAEDIAQF